jgi:hypothetical protein
MNKEIVGCVCVRTCYLAKKEILVFETIWMSLEDIMLSEIKQIHQAKYWIILLT